MGVEFCNTFEIEMAWKTILQSVKQNFAIKKYLKSIIESKKEAKINR